MRGRLKRTLNQRFDTLGYTVHTPLYQDDWLPGAVYEVRAAEDIVGKDQTVWFREGELAATLTTTADSSVVTDPLPLGQYIVTEVSAPAGYVLDETRHEITLTASDHTTPVVTARLSAVNEFMSARITLTKEKGELVPVKMRFHNSLVSVVLDRFGHETSLTEDGTNHFTITQPIAVSPQFFAWMVGLGESAEIIEPVDVRRQMVKHLQKMLEVHKEKST